MNRMRRILDEVELTCKYARCYAVTNSCLASGSCRATGNRLPGMARNVLNNMV